MNLMKSSAIGLAISLMIAVAPATALNMTPGKGITVRPARAT